MRLALILITAVLQVMSRDLEDCEIFPRNPFVPYGSSLTLYLKAPSSSSCRSVMLFDPSRIYWTLNKRKIDERFYDFNSTFLSVSLPNLSIEGGTVECFLNSTTPVLLHGTFVQTYPLLSSPQNVSCIMKIPANVLRHRISCTWDHDQYSTDIKYIVHLKQNEENTCETQEKTCTFEKEGFVILSGQLNVSVTAENSYGDSAQSSEVSYSEVMAIFQMDSPQDVLVAPLPTGLMVTWKIDHKEWIELQNTECEIQSHEKDSDAKAEHILLNGCSGKVIKVKQCTNYTVSVRSRQHDTVWSPWSHGVTALSYLNVSSLQFHLWRSRSVLGDQRKRTVHLMWKGVPPSCNALDEYCIFSDLVRLKCVGPYQDHAFITLDEHPHSITVAALRNETSLNEASIEVPAMAEEVNLPPVGNISVFVQPGGLHITWKKHSRPVSGYIIVWNSTAKNHMWNQTLKTSFILNGEPSTYYTITVTPLYKEGPGNEITLHNCSQGRTLANVSKVKVTVVNENSAEIHWKPVLQSQSCAFILNYTVIYQTVKGQNTRNVTVESNRHHVTLKDLQTKTSYKVSVMANTQAGSSTSTPIIFSTKPNSQVFLIVIIACCLSLIVLPMLSVMIQRELLSKRIPDPRFSSLSMWPSDKCRKPWSLFSVPGDRDTEKILPCHVDSEVISVSPTSITDMASVKALTDIQNTAGHETASQKEITPLAASFSNKGQLPFGGKEQRVPSLASVDLQISGVCPPPPIQSPYRKQTPLSSPVELSTKPPWSDETETLLTPKLKNTTYFTSYVTLDMFDSGKHTTK